MKGWLTKFTRNKHGETRITLLTMGLTQTDIKKIDRRVAATEVAFFIEGINKCIVVVT